MDTKSDSDQDLEEFGLAGESTPTVSNDDDTDSAYSEIVSDEAGYDALGAALEKSPAFQELLAKRATGKRPSWMKQPLQPARDWDVPLGPVYGQAGTSTVISFQPQAYFRVEKIAAEDSWTPIGGGSFLERVLVGRKLQKISGPTSMFTAGVSEKWDTCQPAFSISLVVKFHQSCTWFGTLFGKAVV